MKPFFSGGPGRNLLSWVGLSALVCSGVALLGCDDGSTGTGGAGGTGAGGTTASTGGGGAGGASTGGTGGASTGGAGGTGGASTGGAGGAGGSGGAMAICDPQCAANEGVASECVAIVDNAGQDVFGLRVAQLHLTKPQALTSPLVASLLEGAVTMNLSDCYLTGDGTFSWLMEVDAGAGTLKTGGAKPNADPTAGYCFANETLGGVQVAPLVASAAPDAGGTLTMDTGGDLVLPIYLNGVASYILLPLRNLKIVDAQLSPDQNCIGSYNGDQLSPLDGCEPSGGVQRFTEAGTIDAYITLEDADGIVIAPLNESLCVLLTGDPAASGSPKKCARDPGTGMILAKGDWCSSTDSAGGCMDAMKATGTFAASAVKINGDCP